MNLATFWDQLCQAILRPVRNLDSSLVAKCALCTLFFNVLYAQNNQIEIKLGDISGDHLTSNFLGPRDPSSYFPNDIEVASPFEEKTFWSHIFERDSRNYYGRIENQTNEWEELDRFFEDWGIEERYEYLYVDVNTPFFDDADRTKFVERQFLRFLGRRIQDEYKEEDGDPNAALYNLVKRPQEGDDTAKSEDVSESKQKPKRKSKFNRFQISEDFRLIVRGKINRGRLIFRFDQPYFDDFVFEYQLMRNLSIWDPDNFVSRPKLLLRKNWTKLGLSMFADMHFFDSNWNWILSKDLGKGLSANLSTIQNNAELPFVDSTNEIFTLNYNLSF